MINRIISFSIKNKFIVGLFVLTLIGFGIFSMVKMPLGAVPDITNNQVQVITTSPNLGTSDIEQFVTYPVELSMANLPGVEEIRSISRFGLSVVTIVFKDDMGTYLPRQLVSEKLNEVQEEIPKEFGNPSMGPISTGLGEIYQYYLTVDPGYESQYNDTTLRTIQDWIIKRQMAMLPGVVEVNSFGGHIKEYEVAIAPERLKSMGITISEIYNAIQKNNANTGGAYITSNHKANFIRGEGLASSLEDLKNIVIKTEDGLPILVKDVAKVHYGSAVRYGAFTKDGEGEAVGGTIMMLKNANPNEVVQKVKNRITQIQKSLPEGVHIKPFLDRSKLIGRTTHTVSKNLIEGALIVIFVLVILLGNFRGGLIVASVIPLSLLFAFIMMKIFDIPANLMSLGAIDFGILVDGAVIIVEGVVHLMDKYLLRDKNRYLSNKEMDSLTYKSGSKMMNSAFFGQLIILIVFFPILTLTGQAGKMFRPMALTFSFAVIGAMILCLTYVPMVSSLFLRKKKNRQKKKNFMERFSARIMKGIEKGYSPLIHWALKKWQWILSLSIALLLFAGFTFSQMGAVFIPSLDEGDIAMQAMLKPGSSLNESINVSNKAESILLKNFPEVKHVVARIGVSEIPTDPMPMDIADMFILMKPEKEWTSANNKEALIQQFKEKLSVLPGVNFQFSQPVELRFNELLTGVREDVAVKIYGDDLKILSQKANELASNIRGIRGVGDLHVEATQGLPQLTIHYKRQKLAQYGLNISDLNTLVETAFAGKSTGQVFEGEKRFDIVLRLDKSHRNSIDDIKDLYIPTPTGNRIPLKEVARIGYQPGPMQISRDGTKRRIYVGINVRGRDVESLVHEIQEKLDQNLSLPPGYYITYGGEFKNLQTAKRRLGIVVPIALALIFILLFFALNSFKQTIMIYMAIPLAAIGGIFSLYLRGIPFSISAGVGFVVLFGVAVLNGLVLINSLNDLKQQGVTDLRKRIYLGTKQRLRPILLTATAAIMGFTPMALSTSAGAEVQRPLATVVIGGLITATFLTLVVVPILYYLIERQELKKMRKKSSTLSILLLFLLPLSCLSILPKDGYAQEAKDTIQLSSLQETEKMALENNPATQVAKLKIKRKKALEKTAVNIPKTSFHYGQEEFSPQISGIQSYGIEQSFDFPTIYGKRSTQLKRETKLAQSGATLTRIQLMKKVRIAWYQLQIAYKKEAFYKELASSFKKFYTAASLRYQTGETNKLGMLAAQGQEKEFQLQKEAITRDIQALKLEMKNLLNLQTPFSISPGTGIKADLSLGVASTKEIKNHPLLAYRQQKVKVAKAHTAVEKAKLWPSLEAGYALQTIDGEKGFHSFQVGIGIPLWFQPQKAKIQASRTEQLIRKKEYLQDQLRLNNQFQQWLSQYKKAKSFLDYYEEQGLETTKEMRHNNDFAFKNGEIGYVEYIQNLHQVIHLQNEHFKYLNQYNTAVINLNIIAGKSSSLKTN